MDKKPDIFTTDGKGKWRKVVGTRCSSGWCREYGCDFPNCADLSGSEFNDKDAVKALYPDAEFA